MAGAQRFSVPARLRKLQVRVSVDLQSANASKSNLQEQYQQLNEEPSDVDSEFDQEFASWELNEEEGLDDDPLYFVQTQQRSGADIHGAARVGDVERARSASSA